MCIAMAGLRVLLVLCGLIVSFFTSAVAQSAEPACERKIIIIRYSYSYWFNYSYSYYRYVTYDQLCLCFLIQPGASTSYNN